MKKNKGVELNYDLLSKCLRGEPDALTALLQYYDPYITTLATETVGEWENERKELDEDIKAQIQEKLLDVLKKWEELI